MSHAPAARRDNVAVLCGWLFVVAAALTPVLAWLGPLGFAPLVAVVGLFGLPAFRITEEDRPLAVVLLVALIWAAISMAWSPFRPDDLESNTILKLALQLVLYWSCWCAARRADPGLARLALAVLAWGLGLYGALLLIEAVTGGGVYQALRNALHDPIPLDLGRKNLAHGSFVLALLWPVAAAGGFRAGAPSWLTAPMIAGTGVLAWRFLSDAPVLAIGLAVMVGMAAWSWPRGGPRILGAAAALQILVTPLAVLAIASLGLHWEAPLSWAERLGIWGHTADWIAQHPLRGWGLVASRSFGAPIPLHPHDGSLQLWLELGPLGAALFAAAWLLGLRRLAQPTPNLAAAGAAASAAVYLLFGAVNFGVWQEWWLALGALTAAIAALAERTAAPSTPQAVAARPSTEGAAMR
jgi:O-antigen ligase